MTHLFGYMQEVMMSSSYSPNDEDVPRVAMVGVETEAQQRSTAHLFKNFVQKGVVILVVELVHDGRTTCLLLLSTTFGTFYIGFEFHSGCFGVCYLT